MRSNCCGLIFPIFRPLDARHGNWRLEILDVGPCEGHVLRLPTKKHQEQDEDQDQDFDKHQDQDQN